MPLFDCHDVHYAYQGRFPALAGVDLSIEHGLRVALVGANGSGKSTLLSMLDGLVFPQRGSIRFDGRELTEAALQGEAFSLDFRRRVGLVFQNPDVQLFCPTVREDIAFGPLQLGFEPRVVESRIESLAQDLGIAPLLDRPPHQLSVWEKRKVSFATVLAIEPEVLLLDEPTAGLDRSSAQHVQRAVLAARQTRGTTLVIASHDLDWLKSCADEVLVLEEGRMRGRLDECST